MRASERSPGMSLKLNYSIALPSQGLTIPTHHHYSFYVFITRIHIADIAYNLIDGYELRKEALQERASTA
jgi:hypothetical protein